MTISNLRQSSFAQKTKDMNLKLVLKYGLISGGLIISTFFITFYLQGDSQDFGTGEIIGYSVMLLAFTAIFIGLKNFRDKTLGGLMTFKQGFLNGLGIVLVASIIYVLGWMLYQPNFAPDFADKYNAAQVEKVKADDTMSDRQKEEKIAEMEAFLIEYKKPHVMAAFTFLEIFPIGLVVALISSLVLMKRKPK